MVTIWTMFLSLFIFPALSLLLFRKAYNVWSPKCYNLLHSRTVANKQGQSGLREDRQREFDRKQ